ncbi:MAG: beta-lactamase family protein [Novosphingobium sp.]|nr:beta-lactamase family protein [Novosphingobium sp.]
MTRLASLLLFILISISLATPSAARSLASVGCEGPPASDASQSPSTASALRQVRAWLDAMRTLDDAAYVRFIQDRGPVLLGEPAQWLDLRSALRSLEFCAVKSAEAGSIDVWMFDPNWDSYGIASFKAGAMAPDRIEFVFLRMADEVPPGFPRPPKLAPALLVEAVRSRAASRAAEDQFSGAVLLARRGRVIFQQAYGFADRANHKPNALDTQFRFGSMGKMFTTVAIMQLAQDGRIDLGAPIGRYLADYPNSELAAKVTIANLLTHTGGTGDIFGPDFDAHKDSLRSLADYVGLYGKRPLDFTPGSRVAYSNYGFILLGRIVEQVSGLRYDAYIRRNILDPAGMTSTGNLPESDVLPRRAIGYMGSETKLVPADETLPLSGTSAGGGYSTVGDFNRFVRGLTSHRLLRRATLRKLIDGGMRTNDGRFVHFDFGGSMAGTGRYIGHNGGAPGMSGALYHFLDSDFTLIVLANRDPGAAESIALFAAHRLPAH